MDARALEVAKEREGKGRPEQAEAATESEPAAAEGMAGCKERAGAAGQRGARQAMGWKRQDLLVGGYRKLELAKRAQAAANTS